MTSSKHLLIISTIISAFILNSCKDDCPPCDDPTNPECGNYDPNFGQPSADFTMRQSNTPLGWEDRPEEIAEFCDTILVSNPGVLFTAVEEDALRYEWTIGEDNRTFSTREVALRFDDYLANPNNVWKPIPVKLKVVKVPDAPHDASDSVYISERFLVFADEWLWNGTFEGYFVHEPNITRRISFDFTKVEPFEVPEHTVIPCPAPCMVDGIFLNGFPPLDTLKIEYENTIKRGYPNLYSYKQRKWKADESDKVASGGFMALSSGVTYFHAYATPSSDGKHQLRLEYRHQTQQNGPETTYIFSGTKLN